MCLVVLYGVFVQIGINGRITGKSVKGKTKEKGNVVITKWEEMTAMRSDDDCTCTLAARRFRL